MSEVAAVTNAKGDEQANLLAGKRAKGQAYLEFLADMHGAIGLGQPARTLRALPCS
ncbi:hypothetical protein RAZWK3B_00680 [Roseobacter sp. AzwK-3b]|uniref:hypothetical protein n=1 Tax=Roseobacter sp. AzwK-3b TaxID=351016 RepID=UPI000156956E|nr:hypothetical protein [Roseobacter sp. AzwK-3b]EDM72690.1 hypothetical protein RAZWK3B_00680 [Roseobacter sp. AzwK-3b]